ncbi:hypothetical protein QFC20_004028 [Naganishia adeliensis]|uniref:Uncharacterized protein n=1 Tax=Naganishia adeliensis TaxID=92952 RepID=A0ACC2W7W8_9TREE|nr:hypothetical protein QFC20_004028 [Naganishia adeliensis]
MTQLYRHILRAHKRGHFGKRTFQAFEVMLAEGSWKKALERILRARDAAIGEFERYEATGNVGLSPCLVSGRLYLLAIHLSATIDILESTSDIVYEDSLSFGQFIRDLTDLVDIAPEPRGNGFVTLVDEELATIIWDLVESFYIPDEGVCDTSDFDASGTSHGPSQSVITKLSAFAFGSRGADAREPDPESGIELRPYTGASFDTSDVPDQRSR